MIRVSKNGFIGSSPSKYWASRQEWNRAKQIWALKHWLHVLIWTKFRLVYIDVMPTFLYESSNYFLHQVLYNANIFQATLLNIKMYIARVSQEHETTFGIQQTNLRLAASFWGICLLSAFILLRWLKLASLSIFHSYRPQRWRQVSQSQFIDGKLVSRLSFGIIDIQHVSTRPVVKFFKLIVYTFL